MLFEKMMIIRKEYCNILSQFCQITTFIRNKNYLFIHINYLLRIFIQDIPFKNNIYIYARKKVPVFRRYLVQKGQKKVKKDKEEGKVKNSITIP